MSQMTRQEAANILKISIFATPAETTKAYRQLAKQYHPDKNPNNPNAEDIFKKLSLARTIMNRPISTEPAYQMHTSTGTAKKKTIEELINDMKSNFIYTALDAKDKAKIDKIAVGLVALKNLQFVINLSLYSTMLGLIGMMIFDQVKTEDAPNVGLVVYPIMMAAVASAGIMMDKTDTKKREILNLIDEFQNKNRQR